MHDTGSREDHHAEHGHAGPLYRGLWALCIVLAFTDIVHHRHTVFRFEEFPAFYGLFAFVAGIGLVFACRLLRRIVSRDEDYYDR